MDNSLLVRSLLEQTGIQSVLDLEGITEVAINQPGRIWYDRGNDWEYLDEPRCDQRQCIMLANALVVYSSSGVALDFSHPIASVILPDGERGQIIIAPATEDGCVSFTFRKPSLTRFELKDYVTSERFAQCERAKNNGVTLNTVQKRLLTLRDEGDFGEFFRVAIENRLTILLVGGTGSGKTTVMKALVDLYPTDRRMITIEDVHELNLPKHPNHLHLFYKDGGVTPKRIIESCMRMKPDNVFLAELRGDEAWNYLEMLNTGHAGSITTIHANDCYSAFSRLAALVKQSDVGQTLDYDFIMKTVKTSIDIVCFFSHTYMTELYFNPEEKNKILSEK